MPTFRRTAEPVRAFGRAMPRAEERFLPEGVISLGNDLLAGVCIQDGPDALTGALWFYQPSTETVTRLPMPGRPGFIRPITGHPSSLLVGMDLALVRADFDLANRVVRIETIDTVPDSLVAPGDAETIGNDGTVDPTGGRVVWGLKNARFGEGGRTGMLLQHDRKGFRTVNTTDVCPNGNAFVLIDGKLHLIHIETKTQKLVAMRYNLASGEIGAPRVLFSFDEPGGFPIDLFHHALMPDGLCHWTAGGRDKIAVGIFDYRPESEAGMAMQLDVTNGKVVLEGVYDVPHSPRVTCPALHWIGGEPHLFLTTADEGLLSTRRKVLADYPDVGLLFTCDGSQLGQGKIVSCLHPYQL